MPRKSKSAGKSGRDGESRRRNSRATTIVLAAFAVGILGNTMGKGSHGVDSLADAAAALLFVIAAIVAWKPEKKLANAAEAPSRHSGKPGTEDAPR